METNSVQQEILLVINTSLAQRELWEEDTSERGRSLSPVEQLEAACWNGWLDEMLPGIVDTSVAGKSLYLWEIMPAKSFLNIELGEAPQQTDMQFSINPYAVLSTVCYA